MTEYDIPENAQQLFENGERSYCIKDADQPGDNIFALRLFLESVGVPAEMIEEDEGTRVTLFDGEKRIVIDSGGLGDFHLHGYNVTVPQASNALGVTMAWAAKAAGLSVANVKDEPRPLGSSSINREDDRSSN